MYNLGAYGLKLQGLITDYTANINYGISESIQASNWLAFYQNCFVFCKKLNKKQTFGSDLDEECKQFICSLNDYLPYIIGGMFAGGLRHFERRLEDSSPIALSNNNNIQCFSFVGSVMAQFVLVKKLYTAYNLIKKIEAEEKMQKQLAV